MSTYQPIASVTLSSAQSSVTFSGIPQTYTDLVLVTAGTAAATNANNGLKLQFNSDTGNNYSTTFLYGNGTAAYSGRSSSASYISVARADSTQSNGITHIQNYANTTTNKTVLSRGNVASSGQFPLAIAYVGLWRSTSAVTSLTISHENSVNFDSGFTFNLYGIANASITNVAKATGGDSVYTDGTYWYHIFRSSGTFTPTEALTADYLVVAGGGGGNNDSSGGGGAGGLRSTVTATGGGGSLESALSLTAQAYTVTVGAGGAYGANGSNSVFSTITSTGGGRGGGNASGTSYSGATGGSGGGGGAGGTNTGGAGTANQGYAGGAGKDQPSYYPGGGGGGAGAAGQTPANGNSQGGNGGAGVAVSITGSSVTYAGGGGGNGGAGTVGGTGGSGGGGNGGWSANQAVATNGTANTGGGAGGGNSANQRSGGSGIVIVRYSAAA